MCNTIDPRTRDNPEAAMLHQPTAAEIKRKAKAKRKPKAAKKARYPLPDKSEEGA